MFKKLAHWFKGEEDPVVTFEREEYKEPEWMTRKREEAKAAMGDKLLLRGGTYVPGPFILK